MEPPPRLPLSSRCPKDAHPRLLCEGILATDCADASDLSELADRVFEETGSQGDLVARLPRLRFQQATPNDAHLLTAAMLIEGATKGVLTLNYDLTLPVVNVHRRPFTRPDALPAEAFTILTAFPAGSPEYVAGGGIGANQAVLEEMQPIKRDVQHHRNFVHQFGTFFSCSHDLEHVLAEGSRAIVEDWLGYIEHLFEHCALTTVVTDFGTRSLR